MADLVEITTHFTQQHVFYKVTSHGIRFEVKSSAPPTIGLASQPFGIVEYSIILGLQNNTFIKKRNGKVFKINTPNLISDNEFRGFMLVWYDNAIQFGRFDNPLPIFRYRGGPSISNLKYITLGVSEEARAPCHWRLELPPTIEKPSLKPINGGKPRWVPCENQLPDGLIIGGFENEPLYIIRAHHRGSLTPGKFMASLGLGFIPWGGASNEKSEFEALCGYDCIWVRTVDHKIPPGAVVGGYSEVQQEELFVGRATINGHLIPGKVQRSHKVCYMAYEGREHASKDYEVLVVPNHDKRQLRQNPVNSPVDDIVGIEEMEDLICSDNEEYEEQAW